MFKAIEACHPLPGAAVSVFPLLVIVHALAATAALAWHIRGITALAIAFVVVEALIRLGGLG